MRVTKSVDGGAPQLPQLPQLHRSRLSSQLIQSGFRGRSTSGYADYHSNRLDYYEKFGADNFRVDHFQQKMLLWRRSMWIY